MENIAISQITALENFLHNHIEEVEATLKQVLSRASECLKDRANFKSKTFGAKFKVDFNPQAHVVQPYNQMKGDFTKDLAQVAARWLELHVNAEHMLQIVVEAELQFLPTMSFSLSSKDYSEI
jgi:hypothetical protein